MYYTNRKTMMQVNESVFLLLLKGGIVILFLIFIKNYTEQNYGKDK